MDISFRNLQLSDLEGVKKFTDLWIGKNYYSLEELNECYQKSLWNNECVSFIAFNSQNEIVGVRLTFAPGKWTESAKGISPDLWNVDQQKVAYFKSLFIAQKYQKMGIGKELSQLSMNKLLSLGTKAVICHSWLESPNNSSQRYLMNMNFSKVRSHEKFWFDIDYFCTRCGPDRCICTAIEMIKYL